MIELVLYPNVLNVPYLETTLYMGTKTCFIFTSLTFEGMKNIVGQGTNISLSLIISMTTTLP